MAHASHWLGCLRPKDDVEAWVGAAFREDCQLEEIDDPVGYVATLRGVPPSVMEANNHQVR